MWPLLAGMAARAGLSTAARGAASSATRSAVTSAASSGSISAGTATASSGSRLLSAAQFANSGVHAAHRDKPAQSSAPPPQTDQTGWLRS